MTAALRRVLLAAGVAVRLVVVLLAVAGCAGDDPTASAPPPVADLDAPTPPVPRLAGEGWIVWASDRDGAWRIWIRALDRSPARILVSPEEGRRVCCPRLSPDGRSVVFLSFVESKGWPRGELRLIGVDGGETRPVAEDVPLLSVGRAAVWLGPGRLAFLDPSSLPGSLPGSRTVELELATGARRTIVEGPPAGREGGWLPAPTLRWATGPEPSFSPLDRAGVVRPRPGEPGRRPSFSPDGRWGLWVGPRGGPIRRLRLDGGERSTVISRNDRRYPGLEGELSAPAVSSDGRALAFVVTPIGPGERNDDVFVAELDPETLAIAGQPIRYTSHSARDLDPDVWRAPAGAAARR